ncbi:hypothetical protein EMCRGX_G002929 [Ephydatia muelleri]
MVRVATDPNESDQLQLSLTLLRTPIVRGGWKVSEVPTKETQLRKRPGKGTSTVGVEDVSKVTVEEGMEDGEEVVKDPLKWFGVLLPKCLPQAQQNFMEAITYVVDLAQAQERVEFL